MKQLQRLALDPEQIPEQLSDRPITLTPAQHHYLRRVLRLQDGDRFIALDGRGREFLSEIASSPEQAIVLDEIQAAHGGQTELPATLILLTAMPKQGMDDVVRQSTELGVAIIQPVVGDRTILKPSSQKVQRWQRIAQEAAEQSERQVVPTVLPPCPLMEGLEQWQPTPRQASRRIGYICAARWDADPLLQLCFQGQSLAQDYVVAVGPEGGWTEREMEWAIALGYCPVSLGSRILRAATAPIVALSLMASVLESPPPDPVPYLSDA